MMKLGANIYDRATGFVISSIPFFWSIRQKSLVVVGVTSNVSKSKFTISLTNEDLEEGKFLTKCCIKADNILKIDKEMIIKKIGKVDKVILKSMIDKFFEIIKI